MDEFAPVKTVMRAKVRLNDIVRYASNPDGADYIFSAQYSNNPEDNNYSKYTPSANFKMWINNPIVEKNLNIGETYYVDFTKVDSELAAAAVLALQKSAEKTVIN